MSGSSDFFKADKVAETRGVTLTLGREKVLDNVDFVVPQGQMIALIGPNGSGKTTLLKTLLGLQKPDTGQVRLFGSTDLRKVIPRVGYVPQRFNLERSFMLSVREFLCLRAASSRHWFWKTQALNDPYSLEILEEIGVRALLD